MYLVGHSTWAQVALYSPFNKQYRLLWRDTLAYAWHVAQHIWIPVMTWSSKWAESMLHLLHPLLPDLHWTWTRGTLPCQFFLVLQPHAEETLSAVQRKHNRDGTRDIMHVIFSVLDIYVRMPQSQHTTKKETCHSHRSARLGHTCTDRLTASCMWRCVL